MKHLSYKAWLPYILAFLLSHLNLLTYMYWLNKVQKSKLGTQSGKTEIALASK